MALALLLMGAMFAGAAVGIQYFYEDFVAAKLQIKETFGIVTQTDRELLAQQEAEQAAAQEAASYLHQVTINGYDTTIDFQAENFTWFDTYQMMVEVPNTFVFWDFEGYDIWLDGQAVQVGEEISYTLHSLGQAQGIPLTVTSHENGQSKCYYIRTLPSSYNAAVYCSEAASEEGYYYFTSSNTMFKMDAAGNVVFYKQECGTVRDFKQTIVDGKVYYSYLRASTEDATSVTISGSQGFVMNEQYQIIDVVEYLSTQKGMPANCLLDDHEFVVLGEGHYLVDSYVYQQVENVPTDISEQGTAYVQASVVQEIKDGVLVFQWCSTDYPELYAYSVRTARLGDESVTNAIDYLHFNAVTVDPSDGNFIFSFRAMSALMKVDRTTGDIIWILGGAGDDFGLTEEQKISYQHDPNFFGDTITVFDNGNDYAQTRAVEYVLEEESRTVLEFNAYQIDGFYASAKGSAQRLSEESAIYLMGWGESENGQVVFTEINFDTGEILFQLIDFDCGIDYHADSYRVYKFDT